MFYVNEDVKGCVRINGGMSRYGYHRYDMNENPEGLPKAFVDSVLQEITPEFLAIYPETDRFTKKYAEYIGVLPENVVPVNGSDMAIRYILEVFCEKGREVLTVTPSFEMYAVNCSILGLKHKAVSYQADLSLDINEILDNITEDTDIVVLLNPNNPVGNVYTRDELEAVIAKAEDNGAIVLIDEAYHYFYKETFLQYAMQKENVIVLRTFSKMFSLAACRLGVAISNPVIISYIKKTRLSFDTNAVALLFGERLLDNPQVIEELINAADQGKKYILDTLSQRGYDVRDCRGNFIFVKPKTSVALVEQRLREQEKVLVKTYRYDLLKDYIRVSTGSVRAMEFFAEKFLSVDC